MQVNANPFLNVGFGQQARQNSSNVAQQRKDKRPDVVAAPKPFSLSNLTQAELQALTTNQSGHQNQVQNYQQIQASQPYGLNGLKITA